MLDSGLLGGVREIRAGISHMSLLLTSKTKLFLEAFLSLFWSELLDFYDINIHGIGVFSCSRGREGLESLGRPSTSLGDLFHTIPLVLEMDCFRVSIINLLRYSIKGHDVLHEQDEDSDSKETD